MLIAPGPFGAQPWVSLDPAQHGEPWVRELVASACGGTERGTGLGDATAWWHMSPCPRVLSIHPSGKHKAGESVRCCGAVVFPSPTEARRVPVSVGDSSGSKKPRQRAFTDPKSQNLLCVMQRRGFAFAWVAAKLLLSLSHSFSSAAAPRLI